MSREVIVGQSPFWVCMGAIHWVLCLVTFGVLCVERMFAVARPGGLRFMALLIGEQSRRTAATSVSGNAPSAGIIIIGDEILKGYTKDTNSTFLCKQLFKLGVKVQRISVVSDEVDVIVREVASFSPCFTHVFTSGGIGPTHDDVSYEGIAKAFGETAELNPELKTVVEKFFGVQSDLNSPVLKLAKVPKSAVLLWGVDAAGRKSLYPVVQVRNVTIFPGIPRLLERSFSMLKERFAHSPVIFSSRAIFVSVGEFEIANILTDVAQKYAKNGVQIGSYPELIPSYYKVKITIDASDEHACRSAHEELLQLLRKEWIVSYDPEPQTDAASKLDAYLARIANTDLHMKITQSLSIIEETFSRYSPNEICMSFNGGKDCTALLHLLHCFVQRSQKQKKLKALYISHADPFSELEAFVEDCVERYELDFLHFKGDIRHALCTMQKERPEIKAVLMGTRHSDPNSAFEPTDEGWPSFMRVSPLLAWSYKDIWSFLREIWIPYCPLYDRGYTSIGSRTNTQPNKSLRYTDAFGIRQYYPAYRLEDEGMERAGRGYKAPKL